MAEPYIGEIRMVAFNFAPRNYALCNGQFLSIAQNQALFSILGTTYGGDGVVTFALPNLQSRAAMHWSNNHPLGGTDGSESVTLVTSQLPAHTHAVKAVQAAGTSATPAGNAWAGSTGNDLQYSTATTDVTMAPTAIGPGGSSQPHGNMPPVTVLNFVVVLYGLFPSRN